MRQVYVEKTSGADKSRPELEKRLDILQDGDTLMGWRLDRRHLRAVWDLEGDLVPTGRARRRAPAVDWSLRKDKRTSFGSARSDKKFHFQNLARSVDRSKDFQLSIPRSVADAIALPEGRKTKELQRELAVTLYREEMLSFGKARELAGLSKQEFGQLLGERGVKRHYGTEELAEDLRYAQSEGGHVPEEVPEA